MDNNQHTQVTDDQELANVLADMNQQVAQTTPAPVDDADDNSTDTAPLGTPELQFEETPPEATDTESVAGPTEPTLDTLPTVEAPAEAAVVPAVEATPLASPAATPSASPELDNIKKDALEELRPLVDKLDLPPDEKFDTLLLIIRSTDDKSLVNATFDAAKAITDETKRAQALLDVIKEIDYFSAQK